MMFLTRRFIAHPWIVVIASLLLVVLFGLAGRHIEKDNSFGNIIPEDNPQIRYYDDVFKNYFDLKSRVVVGVFSDRSVFNPETLAKLDRITRALAADPRLMNVVSLANVEEIAVEDDVMNVRPMMDAVPADDAAAAAFRERVIDDRFVREVFVSEDENATIIVAMPTFEASETDLSIALYDDVLKLIENEQGREKVVFAGFPMAIGLINKYMTADIQTMLPIVVAVMIVILFTSFRAWRGVWIPMCVVSFAAVTTIGIMVLTGTKLSVIGVSIPIVLVSVGVADGIHIISEFYWQLRRGLKKRESIELTMKEMNAPVVMTSLTTIGGFLSLASSDIVPIREYGIYVSVGVLAAMFFSLAFIPAVLMLLPEPKRGHDGNVGRSRAKLLDRVSFLLTEASLRYPAIIAAVFVVATIVMAFLSTRIVVSHDTMEEFREDSEIRVSDRMLNEHFGGTSTTSVVIDTGEPDGVKDPELLSFMAGLREHVTALPMVGNTESIVDYVERMQYAMHDRRPDEYRLPRATEPVTGEDGVTTQVPGRNLVAQYLLLYEMAEGKELARIVDSVDQRAHMAVNVRTFDSRTLGDIIAHIKDYVAAHMPEGMAVNYTGNGPIQMEIVQLLVVGQVRSLILSFVIVFLMSTFIFRSAVMGVLAVIPLVLTVLFNFSIMVLSGITLNVGTALIASISIGTGVDYAIHLLHRYRIELERKDGFEDTMRHTMKTVGRAILLNALAVGVGFAVLTFSKFVPIVYVGVLMPAMMLASSLGAMVIIPTLLRLTRPKSSI